MPSKRTQFDEGTWQAIALLAEDQGVDFQSLAREAFRDLLRKHGRMMDLRTALRFSLASGDNVLPFPGKKRA